MDENTNKYTYYLDTCIFSNIVKSTLERPVNHEEDMNAMCQIALKLDQSLFVTSPKTLAEFEKDKNELRKNEKIEIYNWWEKISSSSNNISYRPVFNTEKRKPFIQLNNPYNPPRPPEAEPFKLPDGVVEPARYMIGYDLWFFNKPLLKKLRNIFDSDDAEHIFQAIVGGCRYFITIDKKTILNRVEDKKVLLEEICPDLEFVSPSELLKKL